MMMQQIRVNVVDEDLWRQFHPHTEMILTKKGRSLFPKLEYKVQGLNPSAYYGFQLRMERVDNIKYKFDQGEWKEASKGEPRTSERSIWHSHALSRGDELMRSNISFPRLKITNNPAETSSTHIILQSMHKYIPVLTIIMMSSAPDMYNQPMCYENAIREEFRFDFTTFIAVTAYQNTEVTRLKVQHNKYARGFRADATRKRERSSSSADEEAPRAAKMVWKGDEFYAPPIALTPPDEQPQSEPQFASQYPALGWSYDPKHYEHFNAAYSQYSYPTPTATYPVGYPYPAQYYGGFMGMGVPMQMAPIEQHHASVSPPSSYNSP